MYFCLSIFSCPSSAAHQEGRQPHVRWKFHLWQLFVDVSASNVKSPKSVCRVLSGNPLVSLKIDTLLFLISHFITQSLKKVYEIPQGFGF